MKILYLISGQSETIHKHIVEYLEQVYGAEVHPVSVTIPVTYNIYRFRAVCYGEVEDKSRPELTIQQFIKRCNTEKYDVVLIACDTIHPNTKALENNFSPTLGYIDIEHDLIGYRLSGGVKRNNIGCPAFHLKHEANLKSKGYKTVRTRWHKIDAQYPPYQFDDPQPWKDAVLIGSNDPIYLGQLKKHEPFEYGHLFRTVWYKRWHPVDKQIKAGTKLSPQICDTPRGTWYCAKLAKFHFTCGSSSFMDALLWGCIPILWRADKKEAPRRITGERPVNDIVSEIDFVPFVSHGTGEDGKGFAVTTKNMDHKIETLRSDPAVYAATLEKLKEGWFPDDYMSWPTVQESVIQLIEEAKIKR
jgi:hypothetical protein